MFILFGISVTVKLCTLFDCVIVGLYPVRCVWLDYKGTYIYICMYVCMYV